MIKLGITGGIGSGKSVVCEVLRLHNIPVYDADWEAKNLNDTSPAVRKKLSKAFGAEIYRDNKLDRQKFAQIIFSNKQNLSVANKIIHTELAKHFHDWAEKQSQHPIVAIDAAVLFEAGFQEFVDFTITVLAPEELRIERAMKRDRTDKNQILSRIKSQMSDEEKIKLSDFVILNDNKHSIIEQIALFLKSMANSL